MTTCGARQVCYFAIFCVQDSCSACLNRWTWRRNREKENIFEERKGKNHDQHDFAEISISCQNVGWTGDKLSPRKGVGGSTGNLQNGSAFLETVSLFQINISYFVYPISDLIPNSIPYFRPLKLHVSNSWPNHAQPTWNGFYLRKSLRRGFYSPCLMAKKIVSTKQNNHFQARVKNASHLRPKWSNLCSVSDENGGKKIISFDAYIMSAAPSPLGFPFLGKHVNP